MPREPSPPAAPLPEDAILKSTRTQRDRGNNNASEPRDTKAAKRRGASPPAPNQQLATAEKGRREKALATAAPAAAVLAAPHHHQTGKHRAAAAQKNARLDECRIRKMPPEPQTPSTEPRSRRESRRVTAAEGSPKPGEAPELGAKEGQ